ncbi:MAG: hypothetical protein ACR2RE_28500 [Geminicoccaceae bacterium]
MNEKKRPTIEGWNISGPSRFLRAAFRQILSGAVVCLFGAGIALAATNDLPRTDEELLDRIRTAIDAKDYAPLEELVYWEGAGKIKRNIVAFEIRRGLGRKISDITFENFPEDGMAKIEAMDKLRVNMPVTHQVRVTYEEPPINDNGKLPTSVFLVGKQEGAYRIALVVRNFDDDDD